MQKLRGTGTTFSTSGKRWVPFRGNPKIAAQNAKRWRIVRAGHAGLTKDQMRALGELATQATNAKQPR